MQRVGILSGTLCLRLIYFLMKKKLDYNASLQLINHGVSDSLLEKVKTEVMEFFKLPLEEKRKFGQLDGDIEGYGQSFVVSEEQKLDWADMIYMITLPTDLRKPHLLPQLPHSFR